MKTLKLGLCTLALTAGIARASVTTLPTPPPSSYPDTESSVNVPLPDWPDLGRRIALTLSAHTTPSNCVQIAFGQDLNGDEDLEPEETVLRIGIDCGEPFVFEEGVVGSRSPTVEWENLLCTTTTNIYAYAWKQPLSVSKRLSFAKITTRGRDETAAEIAAEITRPGVMLLLR